MQAHLNVHGLQGPGPGLRAQFFQVWLQVVVPVSLILDLTITIAIGGVGLVILHEETRSGWVTTTLSRVERVRWEKTNKSVVW